MTASSTASFAASRHGLNPALNRFHAPIVYHENYSFANWPTTHTFPMDKFARLACAVMSNTILTEGATTEFNQEQEVPQEQQPPIQQQQQQRPLVLQQSDMYRPLDQIHIPREWFAEPTGPIDAEFLNRFLQSRLTLEEKRFIGFRQETDRPELIERTLLEVAGTVLACQLAWQYGIASNLAGGTHHAHRTMGAGYTILNDLAVAANFLTDPVLNQGLVHGVERVLVVDCDVHQGDGTAKFEKLRENQRLSTLSIHCASNYPALKAHSTYDIGVADGLEDDEYMQILQESVNMAIAEVDPDFVLYDAGVDIYEKDKLGRLKVSEQGIRARDRWVLERCVAAEIPVAAVIGGGYDADVDALARRHAIVHEECAHVWRKYRLWEQAAKFYAQT